MSKNILFVVPYVPNLIRVRPYNLIRHLSERGHQITLLTLWSDEWERESIGEIDPYVQRVIAVRLPRWRAVWNCLSALPTKMPLQAAYCWEPVLAHQLDQLVHSPNGSQPFDVVHVEHLRGARYGLYLKASLSGLRKPTPVVWDSVDSISYLFRQAKVRSRSFFSRRLTGFELSRTEQFEGWALTQFDHVLVTSQVDREALLALSPSRYTPSSISVVRNGVDLNYFKPDDGVTREPATLVISGKMSYHANVTMVLHLINEVMPHVWGKRPDSRLLIVGKDPPREIVSLSSRPNITVTGTVKHLPPYLQRATLSVAPIAYGAGIQNKVLEAMACGTPVITTPQAISALEAVPGEEILVAQDPLAFAEAILSLFDSPQRQRRLGEAGRKYVETHHHWAKVADLLERIYQEASASTQAGYHLSPA